MPSRVCPSSRVCRSLPLAALVGACAVSACAGDDRLDRDAATERIQASLDTLPPKTVPVFAADPGRRRCAALAAAQEPMSVWVPLVAGGYATLEDRAQAPTRYVPAPPERCTVMLTPKGEALAKAWTAKHRDRAFGMVDPYWDVPVWRAAVGEVTGVAQTEGAADARATFVLTSRAVPGPWAEALTAMADTTGRPVEAVLRRYDDGWRVVSMAGTGR